MFWSFHPLAGNTNNEHLPKPLDNSPQHKTTENQQQFSQHQETPANCFASFTSFLDGPLDTPSAAVTKQTYLPSLLYFHEEIMCAMNVPPSVPKTRPDRRDLMIKEVEKAANWSGDDKSLAHVNIGWMDRVYFSMNHYADKIVKFLRIDKL